MRTIPASVCWLACAGLVSAQAPVDRVRVDGRVFDERGRPLGGAEVRCVWTPSHRFEVDVVRTGEDGRFELVVDRAWLDREAGEEALGVMVGRRGRASVVMGLWFDEADDVTRYQLADVVLSPGVSLRGIVRDTDGAPIRDAVVFASDAMVWAWRWPIGGEYEFAFDETVPYCATRSDAEGRFELQGVLPFGTRVAVRKPGFTTVVTAPVTMEDRVDVVLDPTGFARGTVVDAAGVPQPDAFVEVVDEDANFAAGLAGSDGSFALPIPGHARYRLKARRRGDRSAMLGSGDEVWRDAPTDDVRVMPIDLRLNRRTLTVAVIDATSEQPIAGAEVAVEWSDLFGPMAQESYDVDPDWGFSAPAADGLVRTHGPLSDEPHRGALVARAPGYVRTLFPVAVDQFDSATPRVTLRRAGRIVGKVIDEVTGGVLAGALVYTMPSRVLGARPLRYVGADGIPLRSLTLSRDDGSFELTDVAPGPCELVVRLVGRPTTEPRLLKIEPGIEQDVAQVAVPRGVTISGAVAEYGDDRVPAGLRVRLLRDVSRFDLDAPVRGWDVAPREALVDEHGSFELRGVPDGDWTIELTVKHAWLGAATISISPRPLTVEGRDLEVELPLAQVVAARVSGTVRCEGAEVATGRLVVTATVSKSGSEEVRVAMSNLPRAYLDREQHFDLMLPPGRWTLRIHDSLTGAVLGTDREVALAPGANARVDLRADCGALRVRFVRPAAGDPFLGQRVWILGPEQHGGFVAWLRPQEREQIILLPLAVQTLHYCASRNGKRSPFENVFFGLSAPTAIREVRPEAGMTTTVEFRGPARR